MRDTTSEICSESDKESLIASPSSFISCLSCGSTESPYKPKLSRARARRESRAPRGIRRELPFRRSGKHYVRGKGPSSCAAKAACPPSSSRAKAICVGPKYCRKNATTSFGGNGYEKT